MRLPSISKIVAALLLSSFAMANDVNISTITQNGTTTFYLQAGVFTGKNEALKRKESLSKQVKEAVEIKNLADKNLFLVQIGPVTDYLKARELKDKLSQNPSTAPSTNTYDPNQDKPTQLPKITENKASPIPADSKLWNLRNADIRAVINEVARVTGKDFVIDPRVQGKISIVSAKPLANQELYQVFLSVLQVSGYAAIPSGAVVKIVPIIDAKSIAPDTLSALRNRPRGDDMMVSVVPVNYVSSEQLVPVLRPLMPQWSNVSAYAPSNMLILSGRADNIRRLTTIIKQVDSSDSNGIDIVHLNRALAMDVANTLKELIKNQPSQGGRAPMMFAPDDKTNSILISGNKTDRIRIRMLLIKLDKGYNDSSNSTTQVVYLHYLRSEDLVPILGGIAQANFSGNVGTTIGTVTRPILDSTNPSSSLANNAGGTPSAANTGNTTPQAQPHANGAAANTTSANTQNEGSTKPTVQIIAEPNTNSIIINAPTAIIRTLKRVIEQLDIKPAQILIEAMVAEVNQDDMDDLGIEWGSIGQTGNPANFRRGFAILNSKTQLKDFQAQIYALATEKRANILSTPSVAVLDNRQAKILVGKQVSIASTSYPNNAGGTTTASPFTTFDRVNVALHLYVRPQITQGQGIQLQIDQGNDTLDPSTAIDNVNPTFSISSIVTSVNVDSGDAVVLGGLTQDGIGNNDAAVPILAGIPGIGRLFQRNIKTKQKKVLMVFIKPIILHSEMDTILATSSKYTDTRQLQLAWIQSQQQFDQTDDQTVLPPLDSVPLPKPFRIATSEPIPLTK